MLLVINLFNYDLSKSTFLILSTALDVVFSTVFIKSMEIIRFLQYKDCKTIFVSAQLVSFDM